LILDRTFSYFGEVYTALAPQDRPAVIDEDNRAVHSALVHGDDGFDCHESGVRDPLAKRFEDSCEEKWASAFETTEILRESAAATCPGMEVGSLPSS
jgi:hypothetical protein